MGADARDRLQLRVVAMHEPVHRAEVEAIARPWAGRHSHRPHARSRHWVRVRPVWAATPPRQGSGRASRLRPTTIPVAAEAAASPVPMTTCLRVPVGPRRATFGLRASPICSASRRCRSVTNSSRGESLPVRAARNSMAVFISCGLEFVGACPLGAPALQQAVDEAAHCSSAHSASAFICAAICMRDAATPWRSRR